MLTAKKVQILKIVANSIAVAFAAFLCVFALDVFQQKKTFLTLISELLIHFLPSIFLLVILWFSNKFPATGGTISLILGGFYVFMAWENMVWQTLLIISGPLILIGSLFLVIGVLTGKINEFPKK